METPSRTVGQVFAESLQPNLEAATLASQNEASKVEFANSLLDMRLPKLTEMYDSTEDGPAKAMMRVAMDDKIRELGDELLQQDGYENRVRWIASNLRDGRIDKRFVDSSFDFIKEAARQPNPELSFETAKAFAGGLLPAAGDFFTGIYGVARYAPQAAFETLKEGKIEEINRVLSLIGKEPIKQDDTPASKLSAYAALQGTYETGRLLQRVARTIADTEKDFTDEALRARFNEDLDLYDTIVSIERGQTKQRDPETGKYVQVVPEDLTPNIAPMGEVLSIDNAASFGAGLAAKKASQAVAKNVLKKRVAAAPRLMTAADIELAEAAERAALQSSIPLSQRALGRTMEAAGRATEAVTGSPLVRGAVAGTGTTLGTGSPLAGVVAGVAAATSPKAKQIATMVPGAVRRTGEKIATTPVTGTTAKALEIFGDTAKGALAGAATMAAPALFVGETPEEVGTLIAGGAAFGAGGSAVGQVKSGIDSLGRSLWRPDTKSVPESARVAPSSYGVPELDSQHANYVSQLPANQANRIEALRKLIGKQNQLFVLSPEAYDALPQTQAPGGARSQGVAFEQGPNGQQVAYIRGGSESLLHETGHVVFRSLPLDLQNSIRDSVVEGYSPDEIAQMRDYYTSQGIDLPTDDLLVDEIVAENFQVALNGGPLGRLGTPLGLAGQIYSSIGRFAERLNLRNLVPGADVTTSETLRFTPSFIAQQAIRNALEAANNDPGVPIPSTAPAPAPAPAVATPTPAPTPTPTPTPTLTPEAAAPAAPAAPAPAPVAPAAPEPAVEAGTTVRGPMEARRQAFVQPTPEQVEANRKLLTEMAARPRGEQEFVQVDYLSAEPSPDDKSPNALVRREQRRLADVAEQSTPGYENPLRSVFEKVFAPYRAGDGPGTVYGFSFDKLVQNVDILQGWISENPAVKSELALPYDLTSPQLAADVNTYLRNQSNGYGGDGSRLVRPADAVGITPENPSYTPVKLSRPVTNVINLLMGLEPAQKLTAKEEFNLRFAEANGLVPARRPKGGIEVNALRNQLRESGFDPRTLNGVLENLRIDRVGANVVRRPDLALPVGEGAFVRAGFMPAPAPETPEFKRWFGDSKVVDEQGNPLVVYHGTAWDFNTFNKSELGKSFNNPVSKVGFFFSPYDWVAEEYARQASDYSPEAEPRVMDVYLSLKNPIEIDASKISGTTDAGARELAQKINTAKSSGYDGAIIRNWEDGSNSDVQYVAFEPTQVKSATGNTGAFSPTNPDIRFMPAPAVSTPEFKRWFGDWEDPNAFSTKAKAPVSAVIEYLDEVQPTAGLQTQRPALRKLRPRIVYHGTDQNFTEFRKTGTGTVDFGLLGSFETERTGIFFAEDPEAASTFANRKGGSVIPVYLDIKSPADLTTPDSTYDVLEEAGRSGRLALQADFQTWELFDGPEGRQFVDSLKKLGYDGVRMSEYVPDIKRSTDVWVAFEPTQVKSATGNTGAFSPTNPDIRFMPLAEEMGRNIDYTTIPPDEKARAALSVDRQPKYGVARDLKAGTPVGLRIDIPAFKRTSEAGDPVYVITVHKKARGKAVGEVIGYDNIAAVDDPVFESNEVGAQKIREGFKKFPIATVEGAYNPSREIPDNIEEWTPVGFDPKEHSYFYDKRTGDPVVSGDRAISVGNTVFVENPVFGNRAKYMYMPAPAPETPEFKRWFGDSKVVDENGKPIRAFHGTSNEFTEFKSQRDLAAEGDPFFSYFGEVTDHPSSLGFWFSAESQNKRRYVKGNAEAVASAFAGQATGSAVYPVFLSIKNPREFLNWDDLNLAVEKAGSSSSLREKLLNEGYDGLVIRDSQTDLNVLRDDWVAFKPTQVKSATGNTGAFSPTNPDIRFMPAGEAPLANETSENLVSTPVNLPLASAVYEEPSTVPSERGVGPRSDSRGAAEAFRQALIEAAASQPAGKAVTIKDVGDYVVSQLFLSDDRTAGAAVTPDGDLVSVFKKKGSKTNINDILAQAAPLAKTLDAYASGDGYLPNLYAKHGFRPVARVKFNREFAPEGWPYEILGEPDVVLMVRDPDGVTGLPALNGDYNAIVPDLPDVSYDEALALQRDAVDQVASNRAFMAAPLAEETIATEPGQASRPLAKTTVDSEERKADLGADLQFKPGTPDVEVSDAADRVSTRVPTAKKATENALDRQLVITADDVVVDTDAARRIASLIRRYPGTPTGINSPRALVTEFQRQISDNLVWLHDLFDAELRERAKLWYDGARKIAERWSDEYDIPRVGIAGALASLSPQKDWFMNVDLARRVIETRSKLQDQTVTREMVNWFDGKFGEKNPELRDALKNLVGKKFSDIKLLERAVALRAYDELYSPRSYQIVTPEGDFSGLARNANGNPSKVAWGGFGSIAKALSSIEDPSRTNVSEQLGEEHKVRNFYNNILLPNETRFGDVTIDTHAVAAGLLRPLAGGDIEVAQNLGAGYSSAMTGASGLYGIYADAYRDAAKRRGRLPREMQSITWEAVRLLFTPEFKTATNKARVNAVWQQVKEGKISPDEARKQIYDVAGGIGTPSWK